MKTFKYDENEPRVPAGNSDGGQWTTGGGSGITDVENKIRNSDYENAAAFDENGKMIIFKKGDQNTVHFTAEEKAKIRGGTITHNHPSNQSFSIQDIQMADALKLGKLRIASSKYNYEFKPPEKGLKPTWAAIYHDTEVRINNKLYDNVHTGKIKEKDALAEIDHLIMSSFSGKIHATYQRTPL